MAKNTAPNHRKPSVQTWADRPKTIRALRAHGEMMRKENKMKTEMDEPKIITEEASDSIQ